MSNFVPLDEKLRRAKDHFRKQLETLTPEGKFYKDIKYLAVLLDVIDAVPEKENIINNLLLENKTLREKIAKLSNEIRDLKTKK